MFGNTNLYSNVPNAVSNKTMFGKNRNFKFLVTVGMTWNVDGVLLRGNDAKESSGEPANGNNNEVIF